MVCIRRPALTARSGLLVLALGSCLVLAASGCNKRDPAPPAAATADAVPATPAAPAPSAAPDAAPTGPDPAAVAEPVPGTEAPAADAQPTEAPPTPAAPQVSEEDCKKACDNALAITLRELPPEAKPEMKAEVEKVLRDDCPKRCREVGTPASVDCITKARSAYDLVACPK